MIEERFEQVRREKQADYDAKMKAREESTREGKKPRGRKPKPPAKKPEDKAQYNFADADSRIIKAGKSEAFEQSYNAQAAVGFRQFHLRGSPKVELEWALVTLAYKLLSRIR